MISEYILNIWIGNVIIFFSPKIYYILSIFPICRVCPESTSHMPAESLPSPSRATLVYCFAFRN